MEVAQVSPNLCVVPSGSQMALLSLIHLQVSGHMSTQVKHQEEPDVRVEMLAEEERKNKQNE